MKLISKITAIIEKPFKPGATDEEKRLTPPETVTLRPSDVPVEVPDWVGDADHYKLGLKDGSIVPVASTEPAGAQAPTPESLALLSTDDLTAEAERRGYSLIDEEALGDLMMRAKGAGITAKSGPVHVPDKPSTAAGDASNDDAAAAADRVAQASAAAARVARAQGWLGAAKPANQPAGNGKGKSTDGKLDTVDQTQGGAAPVSDKSVEQKEADKANLENAGKAGTDTGTPSGAPAVNSGDARTSRPEAAPQS